MKKLSSSIPFYITIAEALLLICVIIFPITYFPTFAPSELPGVRIYTYIMFFGSSILKYTVSLYGLSILYRSLKIHPTQKNCTYAEVITLLKEQRIITADSCKNFEQTISNKNTYTLEAHENLAYQKQKVLQKNLTAYAWIRDSHTKAGFHSFAIAIILFTITDSIYDSTILYYLAGFLCFGGIISLHRGYTEIA